MASRYFHSDEIVRRRCQSVLEYDFSLGFERSTKLSTRARMNIKHYRLGDYVITYSVAEYNIEFGKKDIFRNPFTGVIVVGLHYYSILPEDHEGQPAVLVVYPEQEGKASTKHFIKGDVLQEYLTKLIFIDYSL